MRPNHPYKPAADLSNFYVITPISNPQRFRRRYELYFIFREMIEAAGVRLITVEQAFGARPFMVTEPGNPLHVQVRTVEELWHKENMINVGARRAAQLGATGIAWIDADCRSVGGARTWFEETWHALQHYEFVQMWEHLIDLDLSNNPIGAPQPGFMANYVKYGTPNPVEFRALAQRHADEYGVGSKGTLFGRPGLAWAANMDAFNKVGGLIDFSILGAGDWYMAHALVGSMHVTAGEQYSPAYSKRLNAWQDRCEHWIKRDVGFVPGTVLHDFHGRKSLRGYNTRGQILRSNQFDPDMDLKYDAHGLLQLETVTPRQIKMRDQIRAYFRSRDEDSTAI